MKGSKDGDKKILVVDDQPFICDLFSKVLQSCADVITSQQMEDAKDLISKNEFNLAIIDVALTEKQGDEGFELLKYVRATSPKTKVIIMTGVDTDEMRAKSFALGADYFLSKPLSIKRLLAEIRPYL